jgi:hypothetical protein
MMGRDWHEYVGNLHVHSVYSDGTLTHEGIAEAAWGGGLDFVVVTDHNVYVAELDGYRYFSDGAVLLLTGEEIHDQRRDPQKNHLLVYEARTELAPLASDPQALLEAVASAGGLAFLAHIIDPESTAFGEPDLSWVNWELSGYTGVEIWNFMSEFKGLLTSVPRALFYAYQADRVAHGPFPEATRIWEELLTAGERVVAIGGADAHGFESRYGPLRRVLFPYEFLFRAVNTHVLTSEPLTGDVELDRRRLFHSIRRGNCFVGYDLPAPSHGFRFSALGDSGRAIMGDEIRLEIGVTLQIHLPQRADFQLIRGHDPVGNWRGAQSAVYVATEPGAYRVQADIYFRGGPRRWIVSNPIYVLP